MMESFGPWRPRTYNWATGEYWVLGSTGWRRATRKEKSYFNLHFNDEFI